MIEFIIVFALGWIIGWRINDALRTAAIRALLKELGVTDQDLRAAAARNGIILADAPDTAADLAVVEEISLNQVAAIDSDWDLLEELINRHVLRSDALLDQVDLVADTSLMLCGITEIEGFNCLLR